MDLRAAIVENYAWLRRQVDKRIRPPFDSDDVLHTVIEHMLSCDNAVEGHFRPWAAVVTRNVTVSLMRKAFVRHDVGRDAKMSILPEHAPMSAPQDKVMEMGEYLDKVLALPPREFDVFTATSIMGYGPTRVAAILHMPVGSVKSIDSRCRRVLAIETADDICKDIVNIWRRCRPENGARNALVFRRMMSGMKVERKVAKSLTAVIVIALLGLPAFAIADPPRPDEQGYSAADGDWFRSLKQPGSGMGCCSAADCRYVEYMIDSHGHYMIEPRVQYDDRFKGSPGAEKVWTTVPDSVVIHNKPNPTGHAVACYGLSWMGNEATINPIFCFVPGFGT